VELHSRIFLDFSFYCMTVLYLSARERWLSVNTVGGVDSSLDPYTVVVL